MTDSNGITLNSLIESGNYHDSTIYQNQIKNLNDNQIKNLNDNQKKNIC